ncbi:helix-turn-helix domain-containing protein [Litorilituus lipolyticus]|uniref:Helix-turn-helix domain-containing protein n=2 Tax=Litorilituus lipolyticus TaxID=2491017 RepID=A0A502KW93_9GAMM|nr:helix-turn-helix domain-containing protein [Litorilituus lipolyticus]TPH15776.1 helix-turn-helix domain-containing protein [Litorilituus lipolyticus]
MMLFDLMPDTLCWIKNSKSEFVYGNQYFLLHLGVKHLRQVVGKTDFDFSPKHIAKQFVVDDQKVMKGTSVNNRLEVNTLVDGDIAWFITSKHVLTNNDDTVIGTFGLSKHLNQAQTSTSSMDAVKIPVNFIREHYSKKITVKEIAHLSHLSISALERRFKKHLGLTPKQFINQVRLEQARRLLIDTQRPIAQIAHETGFVDNSYFTRQFMKYFEELPTTLRKQYINRTRV